MKNYLIPIAIALILGGTAYLAYTNTALSPAAPPAPAETFSRYENTEYGYAIEYPADLSYREYAMGNTVFGTITDDAIQGVAEVRILDISGAAGQSLEDAAAAELGNLCAADGPTGSFSCTGAEQVQPFSTLDGRAGFALYLRGQMRDFASGETTDVGKGPYFVLPLGSSATGSRVLVVHPPLNQSAADADAALLRAMAERVTITAAVASPESVAAYVRAHISELSPEPAPLGGTYYVTAIEAHGGAGTVSYEDGHVAHTADFTYAVDPAGSVSVTSFTLR